MQVCAQLRYLRLENQSAMAKFDFICVETRFYFRILPSRMRGRSASTKLCTDLDISLLYILILGTYSKFARKINFLALGVYCPAGQNTFRRSRPQLKLGEEIESSRLVDDQSRKNQQYPTPPFNRKTPSSQLLGRRLMKLLSIPTKQFTKVFPY